MIPIIIVLVLGIAISGTALASGGKVEKSKGERIYGSAWTKYDGYFAKAAADYSVPFKWLKGIAIIESALGTDPRVSAGGVSSDGKSWGLMQFTMPTAKDFDAGATIERLNNPAYSIDLAGQFLAWLGPQFNWDERKVIMSYNQGAGNTKAGKQYASGYYTKFLAAVTLINES